MPGRPAPPPAEPDPASLQACAVTPAHRRSGPPPPHPVLSASDGPERPLPSGQGQHARAVRAGGRFRAGLNTRLRLVPGPRGTAGVQAKRTHGRPGSCPCMETEQDAGEKGAGSHRSSQKIPSAGATTTSIPCATRTSQLPRCTTRHVPVRAEGKPQGEDPPRDGWGGGSQLPFPARPPHCCSPSVGGRGTVSDSLTPTPMEVG